MLRMLSPNETKFWLLDVVAPMNVVIVVDLHKAEHGIPTEHPDSFKVPSIVTGSNGRPRWEQSGLDGLLETVSEANPGDMWISHADQLLKMRVGTEHNPPFIARFLQGPAHTMLLLVLNHALVDYRSGLWMADAFLRNVAPGQLAPACEELIPTQLFGLSDADALIDSWWSQRAAHRWQSAGIQRLTDVMPKSSGTRLRTAMLTAEQTDALDDRCKNEGVNLNSVVATAIGDISGVDNVAHAIDMTRFIDPKPVPGPGLAISHLFTAVSPGPFWETAQGVRAQLFDNLNAGRAADLLLTLPIALEEGGVEKHMAEATVTGAPSRIGNDAQPSALGARNWVVSSARGGGFVISLARNADRLMIVGSLRDEDPDSLLEALAGRLVSALDE